MQLVYLKEGRNYSAADLEACIRDQLPFVDPTSQDWLTAAFLERLRESMNAEFGKSVVKGKRGKFVFHYLGLYDYVDTVSGRNLMLFLVPKFIDFQEGSDCCYDTADTGDDAQQPSGHANAATWRDRLIRFGVKDRDAVLRAIDRYNREQVEFADQMEVSERKRESILELAVRVLRDYLENGPYVVRRRELEINGQGEIDWNTTIDQFQPMVKDGRPYYADVVTEQTHSDEDNYITHLQQCLVTVWGRKLEDLGLSSILRVNVPLLSEDEPDHFGDVDFQVAQINRELNVQFVTRSRETLERMKELILRAAQNRAASYESLSFGLTGVEHLWETACAEVLGTELNKEIRECGFPDAPQGVTFSKYMPRVFWANLCPDGVNTGEGKSLNADKGSQRSKKAGWRLDFIRTWRRPQGMAGKLVILDAKYYCARWRNGSISGQPGTPDIAKQMFYQMAFEDLLSKGDCGVVNAFLLPEDDDNPRYGLGNDIRITETVRLESRQNGAEGFVPAKAFRKINLFTVRIPGLRLLSRYADYDIANDWFEKIVGFDSSAPAPKGDSGNDTPPPSPSEDVSKEPVTSSSATVPAVEKTDPVAEVEKTAETVSALTEGGRVSPIDPGLGCISKAFIRDVMSVPSVSSKEGMMKEYIRRFAKDRGIECAEDDKGNLYLTKGQTAEYYPCLVNHMDTVQAMQGPYVDRHERLEIRERTKDGKTELYVEGMGIGADDKIGCAIALALVDQLPIVKAVFFVEEERGMLGSKELDVEWFSNVGFCLSFDSPERNRSVKSCAGVSLFSDEFFHNVLKPVCDRHGINQFRDEPYTDVVQVRKRTKAMCYNVGNGGRRAHCDDEYLIVEDAQAAYAFGKDLLETLQ